MVKLNRSYDAAGLVQVAPEVVFTDEAWDEQVIADNGGDQHASVESSVTVVDDVAYFGTSAGLVLGYDLVRPRRRRDARSRCSASTPPATTTPRSWPTTRASSTPPPRTTGPTTRARRRWASSRSSTRRKPDEPDRVDASRRPPSQGQGLYGTPAVLDDVVIITSAQGRLIGLDRDTGAVLWERTLGGAAWGSAVVVDDVLLIGDCEETTFHAFDLTDPRVAPPELWSMNLGGCIEATPAVWKGRIYIGSRAGHLYALE